MAQPHQHSFISTHYQAELSAWGGGEVLLCSPMAEPSTWHSITTALLLPRTAPRSSQACCSQHQTPPSSSLPCAGAR